MSGEHENTGNFGGKGKEKDIEFGGLSTVLYT